MVSMIEEKEKKKGRRDWSDFPFDVLVEILRNLLFLDQLSFRGVCNAWRSAWLQCPPQNHPKTQPHWLLFSKKSRTSRSTWEFGDSSTTPDLPELSLFKTKCFLSTHGWLLLSHITQSSIFFFNPLSRARIDLPWRNAFACNYEKHLAFAVSAPPTSPDCTLFSVSYVDPDTFQISTCRSGEAAWTTLNYEREFGKIFLPIKSAVFSAGIFYWVDTEGVIRAFRAQEGTWTRLIRPTGFSELDLFERCFCYLMKWDGQVTMCLYFRKDGRRHHVVLEIPHGDDSMAKMMVLRRGDNRYLLEYYGKSATDMFSIGDCCVSCDTEDDHGHKLFTMYLLYELDNCDCKNSVWIQPKLTNPSPSIAWTA